MFDVDQKIQQWRRDLACTEVCHNSDLDELESHLREEMGHLNHKGLSDEEAFVVASRRLGDSGSLTQEFAKVNAHALFARRILWICVGVLAAMLIPRMAATITHAAALGALTWGMTQQGLYILLPTIQTVSLVTGALAVIYLVKRHCNDSTPPPWRFSPKKKTSFFAALVGVSLAILLSPPLLTAVTARYFGVHDLGRVAMANMYVNALAPAIISLIVIGWLFKSLPSGRKPRTS